MASYRSPADLPGLIPIFPLDGVLLLPRGQLPLNIFEPRYLNMIDQILGRPSPSIRRNQILLVIFFWLWRLYRGDGSLLPPTRTRSAIGPRSSSGLARVTRNKSWAWRFLVEERVFTSRFELV